MTINGGFIRKLLGENSAIYFIVPVSCSVMSLRFVCPAVSVLYCCLPVQREDNDYKWGFILRLLRENSAICIGLGPSAVLCNVTTFCMP